MPASGAERVAIAHVVQRLSAQFSMLASAVTCSASCRAHARYTGHPTREFVPILVEDSARDRLRVIPVRRSRTGTAADSRRR
ncbi:MAG TPA: hypothetical protein VFC16_09080 [Nakamurella sp.]|nr:hypothetical protein [Nakamurella sp.]